jgi:hypothetical protein
MVLPVYKEKGPLRTGWVARLTLVAVAALLYLSVSGLLIKFAPFHAAIEWTVLVHTVLGLLFLIPILWYSWSHWLDYKHFKLSDTVLLGYVAGAALVVCLLSGLVVTWQGLFGPRMAPAWRATHLWSTIALIATALAHGVIVWVRARRRQPAPSVRPVTSWAVGWSVVGVAVAVGLAAFYPGPQYVNQFPDDYQFLYGEDRPFAPSLALTSTGGAFDAESLAGSASCGTSNCHSQILEEWKPSAHRYSAMDPLFQKVQSVMAEQNGPESTRYCGGCHDPISLFSGTKNIFVEDLTGLHGFQEGISCLTCHGVRETDVQGNANYVVAQPPAYLWQWYEKGARKRVSDFLIRTYPDQHNELSKRMYKAPEYCAACHKQFIDQEVNRVGWVQLQNQYDNWKASHWFVEGEPSETIECRECHMPLVASSDPARGDDTDYNRSPDDGMHRSHRFIAANSLVPALLELPGWEEHVRLTQEWLRGSMEVPEIAEKWREGPAVQMALEVPDRILPGEQLKVRVVLTANKVGHDFPTGPLDIIQSWVELKVFDPAGAEIYATGRLDERNFIEPGSFLFKAEPVDQYGNLIDRHNLWEMVGVRYRRALFPGYSDTVEYAVDCPNSVAPAAAVAERKAAWEDQSFALPSQEGLGQYRVEARLMYRKVDQFLINFLLGEDSGLTAPVIEMTTAQAMVDVRADDQASRLRDQGARVAGGAR